MGDGRVRASSARLGGGPSFRGGAKIHSGRGSSNHTVHSGALHVSRLGDQHASDSSRHLAFLRRPRWHGPRICELREDFALRKIPTASFAANALYLEIIRLAYNLVTAFQRNCLQESWQTLTLGRLRYKLFFLPGELTRPQNRPVLRLKESPMLRNLVSEILGKIEKLEPLHT